MKTTNKKYKSTSDSKNKPEVLYVLQMSALKNATLKVQFQLYDNTCTTLQTWNSDRNTHLTVYLSG